MANLVDKGFKLLWFTVLLQIFAYPPIAKYGVRYRQPTIYAADLQLLYHGCKTATGVAIKAGKVVAHGDLDHLRQLYVGARAVNMLGEYRWYPKLLDSPYRLGQIIDLQCGPVGDWYLPLMRLGAPAQFYLLDAESRVIGFIKL